MGMQTGAATVENSMEFPQKFKNRGPWVVQLVKLSNSWFLLRSWSQGCEIEPLLGLWAQHRVGFRFYLPLPLPLPPVHSHALSLKWINKPQKKKQLKIELPYNPAITLLSIYPKNTKTLIQRDKSTPWFITALYTISKLWKQLKCSSIDEWIKRMWYRYTMEYNSAIRKNDNLPFATTWMESIMLSEMS